MTARNYRREILAAHKAGDMDTLLDIALELAAMSDAAKEIERRDIARKFAQAERTRASRERSVTLRNVTSRDVTRQESELTNKTTTRSKASSRTTEPPLPGVSWVTRLHGVWTSLAGAVQAGQVGKQLKALVDSRGEPAVERGMRLYITTRQGRGEPCNFGWFANDAVQWIDKAGKLDVVDGEMTPELELLTRPNGAKSA